jgi:hypothetical protein
MVSNVLPYRWGWVSPFDGLWRLPNNRQTPADTAVLDSLSFPFINEFVEICFIRTLCEQ